MIGYVFENLHDATVVNELLSIMRNETWLVKASIIEAIGLIYRDNPDDSLVKELLRYLNHRIPAVRSSAYKALGEIFRGSRSSKLKVLIHLLEEEQNDYVKAEALEAIGNIFLSSGEIEFIDKIKKYLYDKSAILALMNIYKGTSNVAVCTEFSKRLKSFINKERDAELRRLIIKAMTEIGCGI